MTTSRTISDAPLAVREAARIEPWRNADWQKLWLSVQARSWCSLAVVPAGPGGPPDFTLTIAVTLARTGMMHLGTPIQVADATKIPLAHLVPFAEELRRHTKSGDLVLLALGPSSESPTTVSLAQSADAALLCVMMEQMNTSDARKTVDHIGAARFIGSAVFHADQIATAQKSR